MRTRSGPMRTAWLIHLERRWRAWVRGPGASLAMLALGSTIAVAGVRDGERDKPPKVQRDGRLSQLGAHVIGDPGVFVAYRAPEPDEPGRRPPGFVGYYMSHRGRQVYVFTEQLHSVADILHAIDELAPALNVDVDALMSEALIRPSSEAQLQSAAVLAGEWVPASEALIVDIMNVPERAREAGLQPIVLDDQAGTAYGCDDGSTHAHEGPSPVVERPTGEVREFDGLQPVIRPMREVGCGPGGGGGGGCVCCLVFSVATVASGNCCGQGCDDGNGCTLGDYCDGAECVAESIKRCNDGEWCTTDQCEPATGACIHMPHNGGLPCLPDNGDPCTWDVCRSGSCVNESLCDPGQQCCPSGCCSGECCPDGQCCASAAQCCNGGCCLPGFVCCNGECAPCCDTATGGACQGSCCDPPGGPCCGSAVASAGETCCENNTMCCPNLCCSDRCCPYPDGFCWVPAAAGCCPEGDQGCPTGCCGPLDSCCSASSSGCCPFGQDCCDAGCCPKGEKCCDGVCHDPCDVACINCDDGDPCTIDSCDGGVCAHEPLCPDTVCCGTACCACCDPASGACCAGECCGDGTCCPHACNGCVDNGTLSGGTITVSADPVCIGETITFTAGGVVDSGGTEWVNCVEQPIPAGGVAYAWQLTLPPDYPEPRPPTTGTGTSVSVTAQVPGTYTASFTAEPTRTKCPPGNLALGSASADAIELDLDGDANHDALLAVDGLDDDLETTLPGVIVLCNRDDDDTTGSAGHGVVDSEDDVVNGGADGDDMTNVVIRAMPDLPANWTVRLTLHSATNVASGVDATGVVRVFPDAAPGTGAILGPTLSASFELPENEAAHDVDLAALRAGDVWLWVEGLAFAGEVRLEVDVLDATATVTCTDEIQLKVAPLMLLHHLQPADESYVSRLGTGNPTIDGDSTAYTTQRFPNATPAGIADTIIVPPDNGGDDPWAQDEFQIGYQEAPYAAMHVVLDSKRDGQEDVPPHTPGLKPFPPSLLGPDFGHIQVDDGGAANTRDAFGNLEVSPPSTSRPLGRIYYGDETSRADNDPTRVDKNLRDFLNRQQVQSPIGFQSDWLFVGHVDEFMSIVPNPNATHGWTVLFANPTLALDILKSNDLVTGGVTEKLHIPRYIDHGVVQLGALLGRPTSDGSSTIEQYNAPGGPVDSILTALEAEIRTAFDIEPVSTDMVFVPALFDADFDSGKAVAITPNLINSTIYGSTLIAPDPFLHASTEEDANANWKRDPGEDTNGNFMLDTLRDPFQAWFSSSLPLGVSATYIDDWLVYHLDKGEVHCSSNEIRAVPSSPKWWEQAP